MDFLSARVASGERNSRTRASEEHKKLMSYLQGEFLALKQGLVSHEMYRFPPRAWLGKLESILLLGLSTKFFGKNPFRMLLPQHRIITRGPESADTWSICRFVHGFFRFTAQGRFPFQIDPPRKIHYNRRDHSRGILFPVGSEIFNFHSFRQNKPNFSINELFDLLVLNIMTKYDT